MRVLVSSVLAVVAGGWLPAQPATDAAAFVGVLLVGTYLLALGVVAAVWPQRTKDYLGAFASSAQIHFTELALRLLAGAALVVAAPRMSFGQEFGIFGWVLVVTTVVLALVPWRRHRQFAEWSVPQATRYMPLLAIGALGGGVLLLWALLSGPATGA